MRELETPLVDDILRLADYQDDFGGFPVASPEAQRAAIAELEDARYTFAKCYATLDVVIRAARRRGQQRDHWKRLSELQDQLLACYRLDKHPGHRNPRPIASSTTVSWASGNERQQAWQR